MSAYVTEAEAETYFDGDPRAEAFLAEDYTWYLTKATKAIDALTLRGTRYEYDQDLAFPRIIDGVLVGDADQNAVVPQAVKDACCEEALALYLAGTDGGLKALQENGVQSMSVGGKLSYTFVQGAGNSGLQSATAKRLMRRYMGVVVR